MKSLDNQKPIFIFAGELSGDMHGARLLNAMRKQQEHLQAVGVAGPELRALGVEPILRMEDFQVMGFSDVLKSLPRLWKQFNRVRDYILKFSPDMVIFVDSPSFSLRMAKVLRKRGYKGKIVQYICPTVWAWGTHRIKEMEANFDLLLTIYPFEKAYFNDTKLPVVYVGNPIQEMISQYHYQSNWREELGVRNVSHLIAIFPGSRVGEITKNLKKQLQTAKLLKVIHPEICFGISCAQESNVPLIKNILDENGLKLNQDVFFVPKKYSYELMKDCRSAIAKSGTVTLELALHQRPTVVVFEVSTFNRLIAQHILKVNLPYYCIVNILANKSIYPELIVSGFTPENLLKMLLQLDEEGVAREICIAGCKEVSDMLQGQDASERAAEAVLSLF